MKTIRSIRFLMFALIGLLTIASVLFGSAQPVLAAGPVITSDVISATNPVPFGADCSSFQVLITFTVERQNITFYDEAGNKVRQIRHASFTGTLYNSVTGASLPYEGTFNRTEDFVAHTVHRITFCSADSRPRHSRARYRANCPRCFDQPARADL